MSDLLELEKFDISKEAGFMLDNPTIQLPPKYKAWHDVADQLRQTDMTREKLGILLNELPLIDSKDLSYSEARVAQRIVSHVANSYVWRYDATPSVQKIPETLAISLCSVSDCIGTKPALVHNGITLANVARKDLSGSYTHDNMFVIQNSPEPEDDFFLVYFAMIEVEFAEGLKAIVSGDRAIQEHDMNSLAKCLEDLSTCLKKINTIFRNTYDLIDPKSFHDNVLRYSQSWGGPHNPYPYGIVYEGVSDKPFQFLDYAASQSSIFQVLDAFLNIDHNAAFQQHAIELREYMPRGHREFIQKLEMRKNARETVDKNKDENSDLVVFYNSCIREIHRFRSFHLKPVHTFMVVEGKKVGKDFIEAEFIPPLKTAANTTLAHII